jgi:hypothetical protein
MTSETPHRTLVVANRTAETPLLIEEVRRRARERPTRFALLVPDVASRKHADWTLELGTERLAHAAGGPVEGLAGRHDPYASIEHALRDSGFDDVIISTLPRRTSAWLRGDLPRRVERLGVPVTVITPADPHDPQTPALVGAPGFIMG